MPWITCDLYLMKPINIDELIKAVEYVTQIKQKKKI